MIDSIGLLNGIRDEKTIKGLNGVVYKMAGAMKVVGKFDAKDNIKNINEYRSINESFHNTFIKKSYKYSFKFLKTHLILYLDRMHNLKWTYSDFGLTLDECLNYTINMGASASSSDNLIALTEVINAESSHIFCDADIKKMMHDLMVSIHSSLKETCPDWIAIDSGGFLTRTNPEKFVKLMKYKFGLLVEEADELPTIAISDKSWVEFYQGEDEENATLVNNGFKTGK